MASGRHLDATQLLRQWKLLRILSGAPRWYSIKALAEQLGASKSSVDGHLNPSKDGLEAQAGG